MAETGRKHQFNESRVAREMFDGSFSGDFCEYVQPAITGRPQEKFRRPLSAVTLPFAPKLRARNPTSIDGRKFRSHHHHTDKLG